MIRQCRNCNADFNPTGTHRYYCSDDCATEALIKRMESRRGTAANVMRECVKCGKPITTDGDGVKRIYCELCKEQSIIEAQARYRHKMRGITAQPFASLVRLGGTFGAVVLVQDSITPDLLVVKWLCKDVDEQTARAAIESWKVDND